MSVATHITDNAQDSLSGQKRNVNVESGAGLLSSLMGDTSVTQRWVVSCNSLFNFLREIVTDLSLNFFHREEKSVISNI